MTTDRNITEEPCFIISVAARMVGLHAQTLRQYERAGLIAPTRTSGRQRLYSMDDVMRLRRIKTLTDELGVNLAGAGLALQLSDRINELETELDDLTRRMTRLHARSRSAGQEPDIAINER